VKFKKPAVIHLHLYNKFVLFIVEPWSL